MVYDKALRIAERRPIGKGVLADLKQASKALRVMSPDSALADLVDTKIKLIEGRQGDSRSS